MTRFRTGINAVDMRDDRPRLTFDPSMRRVSSEFKDDCDLNIILRKHMRNGVPLDNYRKASAMYGDFSQIPDFETMQAKIHAAEALFMALPAEVREEFGNSPGLFMKAADSERGVKLLKELGLGREEVIPPATADDLKDPAVMALVRAGKRELAAGVTLSVPAGTVPT